MAQCEVCGNDYDNAFEVTLAGEGARTFDSFECAIHALATAGGRFFCCAHCSVMAGAEGVADRA